MSLCTPQMSLVAQIWGPDSAAPQIHHPLQNVMQAGIDALLFSVFYTVCFVLCYTGLDVCRMFSITVLLLLQHCYTFIQFKYNLSCCTMLLLVYVIVQLNF